MKKLLIPKRLCLLLVLGLGGLMITCKNKVEEPQADWASKFVGTYTSGRGISTRPPFSVYGSEYDYYPILNGIFLVLSTVVVLTRVDDTHLTMSLILKPRRSSDGNQRVISPLAPVKIFYKNVRAIDAYTLVTNESGYDNNLNPVIPDTFYVTKTYRQSAAYKQDSSDYAYVSFRFKKILYKLKVVEDYSMGTEISGTKYSKETTPFPFYSYSKANKFAPNAIFFYAHTDGVKYEWDFGDGESSTEEDPYHVYKKNGEYTFTFKTTDKTGKVYTATNIMSIRNL